MSSIFERFYSDTLAITVSIDLFTCTRTSWLYPTIGKYLHLQFKHKHSFNYNLHSISTEIQSRSVALAGVCFPPFLPRNKDDNGTFHQFAWVHLRSFPIEELKARFFHEPAQSNFNISRTTLLLRGKKNTLNSTKKMSSYPSLFEANVLSHTKRSNRNTCTGLGSFRTKWRKENAVCVRLY